MRRAKAARSPEKSAEPEMEGTQLAENQKRGENS